VRAGATVGENGGVSSSEVSIRRAPKIGVFLILGAVVGLLVTLILTSLFKPDPAVGFFASFAYFCLYGIPAGVALGALVALVLDLISSRRSRTVTVERDEISGDASE
jgi:ABC-type Co2+ transport system permease subunit